MTPIIITKERNTLTITVDGCTWNCRNEQTSGRFAGKFFDYTETCETERLAVNAARRHAKVNGWNIKEARANGYK